ncbi:MAG TPA: AarF/UbiB family protein [Actinomycetota bacterium]|nr:AarF/UbiB family protein [Actinomycetota bacterium]
MRRCRSSSGASASTPTPHPGNVMVLADGRLGILDFGSTGRLDALEQASIADMLSAIKLNDPELLRDALLGIASVRHPIDERQLDRSLARFMALHLGRGAQPSLTMFQDLAQTFLAFGIALPASTTMLFRMLVTLESTLTTLCPGYPVFAAAQDFGPEVLRERIASAPLTEQVRDEVASLLPLLRRMPRHVDRIATLLERGELRTRTSLLSSDEDVRVLTRLVDRLVLALVGAALGLMSGVLLAISGGPVISGTLTLLDVFGYLGMGVSVILLLRVVASVLGDRDR